MLKGYLLGAGAPGEAGLQTPTLVGLWFLTDHFWSCDLVKACRQLGAQFIFLLESGGKEKGAQQKISLLVALPFSGWTLSGKKPFQKGI